jgi:hypothetical protein
MFNLNNYRGHMTLDDITRMCEGNPGAATVCAELLSQFNFQEYFEQLKNYNITGWKIWAAYKDVCRRDITKMMEMLSNETLLEELKKTKAYEACKDM